MDVLKDKQVRSYPSLSRYSTVPFYYNTQDLKYVSGLTKQLGQDTDYVVHKVKPNDTLDSIALFYYGRPDYFWIIADFNRITDAFIDLPSKFETIKVPSISYIYFED